MNNNNEIAAAKVVAVIVTYNAVQENLFRLVDSLQSQVSSTIIVDNGSQNAEKIANAVADLHQVKFIALDVNYGIAHAQNIGVKYGIDCGATHTILFDQDSAISVSFVTTMLRQFFKIKEKASVATLGPALQDTRYGYMYPVLRLTRYGLREKIVPEPGSNEALEVSCIIASGSLIDNEIFTLVGEFNSELFIDYVDTEWCLRCIDKGYKVYVTPEVTMRHEIGDSHISLIGFVIPVHSSWRRYYRVRNGFYLLMMPHVPKLVSLREIAFSFIHQAILLVFTRNMDYLKYYLKSVRDGIKNIYVTYYNRKS